jgi:hypothetical protein
LLVTNQFRRIRNQQVIQSTGHRSTMPAPGLTSLPSLLATMTPILHPNTYVFATAPPADTSFQARLLASQHSFEMLFRESESTVDAIGGLESAFPCKKVTLGVHSSLDAVGFMAAVTTRLATAGLGINPVSGFYHDHL